MTVKTFSRYCGETVRDRAYRLLLIIDRKVLSTSTVGYPFCLFWFCNIRIQTVTGIFDHY